MNKRQMILERALEIVATEGYAPFTCTAITSAAFELDFEADEGWTLRGEYCKMFGNQIGYLEVVNALMRDEGCTGYVKHEDCREVRVLMLLTFLELTK